MLMVTKIKRRSVPQIGRVFGRIMASQHKWGHSKIMTPQEGRPLL